MPFGKHKGEKLGEVPAGYRNWVRSKAKEENTKTWNMVVEYLRQFEAGDAVIADEMEMRKKDLAAAAKLRKHVGTVGERTKEPLRVTCVAKFDYNGQFGPGTISILIDENDNKLKTFGKCAIAKGESADIIFTVKKHDEYKEEKNTIINRIKIA